MIYYDEIIKGELVRKFSDDVDATELQWHRDEETRIVRSCEETDWQIQLENSLPMSLNSLVIIPALQWHRLIKGSGDLHVKITKL